MRQGQWISIREAATMLGFAAVSFRRLVERHARKTADGGTEAAFDGVRAKKLGRTWRVLLGERWCVPQGSAR